MVLTLLLWCVEIREVASSDANSAAVYFTSYNNN